MRFVKFTPHNLRRLIVFLFKCSIVLISALAFFIDLYFFIPNPYNNKGYYLLVALYIILFIIASTPYDIFKIGVLSKRNLQFSYLITSILVNALSYIVLSLIEKKMINVIPFIVLIPIQFVLVFIIYELADYVYHKIYPTRDTLVIYADTDYDRNIAKKFITRTDRYDVRDAIRENEGYEKITKAIDKYDTLIIGNIDLELRSKILDYSYARSKRIFIIPTINDIILKSSHITQIEDSIIQLVKDRTMSLESLIIKRGFDIVFSLLFLILTLPITIPVAICIKLYDHGPIFYKQTRLTRNREKFEIIKFRSMIVDAEKNGAQFTVDNDSRITPIGKFIRRTRIDEIPQFINVLKGEMSVIGPRAERVENYDLYTESMPEFYYRTKVKAGVTGYAQIYGRYNTSPEDKARMDIYYIENYSFLNDLKLILATIKVVFTPEATEGFESSFKKEQVEKKLDDTFKQDQDVDTQNQK